MDSGMPGLLGAAAARLAEEASSRGSESARVRSLVVNLALVRVENRGAAARGDAPVSNFITDGKRTAAQLYRRVKEMELIPLFISVNFKDPHEICDEQNTGDVVWRKTPAGDEAAIACPADASGTVATRPPLPVHP